jgi:rhodanese-related sulfurtransferase
MKIKRNLFEKILLLLITAVLPVSALCCNTSGQTTAGDTSTASTGIFMNKTANEAFDIIQNNLNNPDFVIIDVRTPSEYAEGHIEKAVNIDYYSDNFELTLDQMDKNRTYLVYCHSGNRSALAVNIMKEQGFREVYNMLGGFSAWQNAGLPYI